MRWFTVIFESGKANVMAEDEAGVRLKFKHLVGNPIKEIKLMHNVQKSKPDLF